MCACKIWFSSELVSDSQRWKIVSHNHIHNGTLIVNCKNCMWFMWCNNFQILLNCSIILLSRTHIGGMFIVGSGEFRWKFIVLFGFTWKTILQLGIACWSVVERTQIFVVCVVVRLGLWTFFFCLYIWSKRVEGDCRITKYFFSFEWHRSLHKFVALGFEGIWFSLSSYFLLLDYLEDEE